MSSIIRNTIFLLPNQSLSMSQSLQRSLFIYTEVEESSGHGQRSSLSLHSTLHRVHRSGVNASSDKSGSLIRRHVRRLHYIIGKKDSYTRLRLLLQWKLGVVPRPTLKDHFTFFNTTIQLTFHLHLFTVIETYHSA